jgi:hypothetical protein
MMDKAGRKAHERHQHNADQIVRRQKWAKTETANFLTNYCQAITDEQWVLAQSYVVVRAFPTEWWVYRPDDTKSDRSFPPRYYRLRKVRLVNNEFCWCSCGVPSRRKYPCRHILAVTSEVKPHMFALRWHANFQYHYGRKHSESFTKQFNKMLYEEFSRNVRKGECILVSGMQFLKGNLDWKSLQDMPSDPEVALAHHLHKLQWVEKRAVARGFPLPAVGESQPQEMTLHQITCHLSDDIMRLQADLALTSKTML